MQIIESRVVETSGSIREVPVEVQATDNGIVMALGWFGSTPLFVDRVAISTDLVVDSLLEHGWQSWSTVRPSRRDDTRPVRADAPRWFRSQMLADGDHAGEVVAADTVLVHPQGLLGAADPTSHPLTFVCQPDTGIITVEILLDGIRLEPGERIELGGIIVLEGPPGEALSSWAAMTGAASGARIAAPVPLGWCSWYHYFASVTDDIVLSNLAHAARHNLEVLQIDDGWQRSIGEWTSTASSFGRPIADVAGAIVDRGLTAGIWTAPFLAIEGGPIATDHPEWLVRNPDGRPRTALFHQLWGGRVFALDLSRNDVLDHLESQFIWLKGAGFGYFKIDFLHAGSVPGTRQGSGSMTRVQAMQAGLAAIRRAIGPESFLLGCGAPLGPSLGAVDAMRVSEDVAPHWEPREHFAGWPESTVAAANSVEQTLRRSFLHRRWFANDPDCALLRSRNTELTSTERRTVADTVLGTGGFTMVSDDLSLYGPDEWEVVEAMGASRQDVDGPLEIADPLAHSELIVTGRTHRLEVDLTSRTSALSMLEQPAP